MPWLLGHSMSMMKMCAWVQTIVQSACSAVDNLLDRGTKCKGTSTDERSLALSYTESLDRRNCNTAASPHSRCIAYLGD